MGAESALVLGLTFVVLAVVDVAAHLLAAIVVVDVGFRHIVCYDVPDVRLFESHCQTWRSGAESGGGGVGARH